MTDDEIAQHLAEAAASGELRSAPSWGRAMPPDEGWERTPEALRMPFKILKDAGLEPPEIALFRRRGELHRRLEGAVSDDERLRLQRELAELEQVIALRLVGLRRHAAS